ncbi:MAG TPA: bifunctional nuclease domain-containing protein [Solirubrobacteraceae bacterium]|nr:bifunctional nuclease domain-containing protein [Solirubrobacteraceae bacterium]
MIRTGLDDDALVAAARRGDKSAFAALVQRHYPVLLTSCRRMLGDPERTRDAAQEAVLRAMLGLDRLADPSRFGAWLVGIGLNVCRSLLGVLIRETNSIDQSCLIDLIAPDPDPAAAAETGELAAGIWAAVADLPVGQRTAVALFYLAGLTHSEIADELGTSPGAVKTRLHKARAALRAPLHDLYEEHTDVTDQAQELIPMRVAALRRTAAPDPLAARHIVFLEDEAGAERLPIWIGAAEANALAVILDQIELPRPGVYQFAASLLRATGGELREVRIVELTDSVFFAEAILADGSVVDARPSDALTLALVTGARIQVARAVLDGAAAHRDEIPDRYEEAEQAPDDARAIADDVRRQLEHIRRDL